MRLTKRQLKIVLIVLTAAFLMTAGYFIYKASQKKFITEQCERFLNLDEYTVIPGEYTGNVPDCVINEMKDKIEKDFRDIFTEKLYGQMAEKYIGRIDSGTYGTSSRYEIVGMKKYTLYGNTAGAVIEYIRDGNRSNILSYEIKLKKVNGKWLINDATFRF